MRFFYDLEFITRGAPHAIDVLSVGITAEDGRELYLQNCEADHAAASPWVAEHVLAQLQRCPSGGGLFHAQGPRGKCFREDCPWRTARQLALAVSGFVLNALPPGEKAQLVGYYCAYDHVALSELLGDFDHQPAGWPMWSFDIKQWSWQLGDVQLPEQAAGEHHALADARWNQEAFRFLEEYAADLRAARGDSALSEAAAPSPAARANGTGAARKAARATPRKAAVTAKATAEEAGA